MSEVLHTGWRLIIGLLVLSFKLPFSRDIRWDGFPRSEVIYWVGLAGIAIFGLGVEMLPGAENTPIEVTLLWVALLAFFGWVASLISDFDVRMRAALSCSTAALSVLGFLFAIVNRDVAAIYTVVIALHLLRLFLAMTKAA
jgi:hypothetical protein